MQKLFKKNELPLLIGQDVRVTYKEPHNNNSIILARIIEADETGIAIEVDTGFKVILSKNIKQIESKNLRFINPKEFFYNSKRERDELNIQMDKINTQIIEKIKDLPIYYLSTRNAQFIKNGSFQKKKISQKKFEFEVFQWTKKREKHIQLCPLALLNNELLLALYKKQFLLFKNNLTSVFDTKHDDINSIVTFIFEQNKQIKNKRNMSLRGIAEDLL